MNQSLKNLTIISHKQLIPSICMNFLQNRVEIDNIVPKFKTHPSIVKIKKHFKINTTFSFSPTSKDEIVAIIKDLQNNKAAGGEIPLNFLKKSNFTFHKLTECINYTLKNGKFSDSLTMLLLPQFIKKMIQLVFCHYYLKSSKK